MLADGEKLPDKYVDHKLNNDKHYTNCRDCHIKHNWVLIYRIDKKNLILECVRTGTHGDLGLSSIKITKTKLY